jgi:hypothetical protein
LFNNLAQIVIDRKKAHAERAGDSLLTAFSSSTTFIDA